MKKFRLVFPKNVADQFAEYAYTNEIRVMLSWLQEGDFFSLNAGSNITVICIASEEKSAALFASDWNKFVQK